MITIVVGVDLAKHTFSVCQTDGAGSVKQRHDFRRDAFAAWLAQLPAGSVIAMEACGGAHHWARHCRDLGLAPRLIATQFVIPFRKSRSSKNDRNDAEAIATAARQGNMRFVAVKTVEQQTRLAWHRVREGYKTEDLAVMNRLRGILSEFGIIVAQTAIALKRALAQILERTDLPGELRDLLRDLRDHWQQLQLRMANCDTRIDAHARADERSVRLRGLIGIGPLTADATAASVGDGREFKNGRQMAAWLGLVPQQYSTGGHARLGHISRSGDSYLRTLLIQGARSSVQRAKITPHDKATPEQRWISDLATRMPFGKLLVAVANKHARQIWAMLSRGEAYDPEAWIRHPMVQRNASRKSILAAG